MNMDNVLKQIKKDEIRQSLIFLKKYNKPKYRVNDIINFKVELILIVFTTPDIQKLIKEVKDEQIR